MLCCLVVAGSAEIEMLVEAGKISLDYNAREIQDCLIDYCHQTTKVCVKP
ncbi:MAG: hypothetical protein OFPI_05940 [Osedax symbiont Rs2]|nr:MAG: hypothetical protein OFPI_05940 [Osedax symbiont Rs2]